MNVNFEPIIRRLKKRFQKSKWKFKMAFAMKGVNFESIIRGLKSDIFD